MHTIIPTLSPASPSPEALENFRQPHFECADLPQALKLVVFTPGVDATDVEITTQGPDFVLTARKRRIVRVNWQALHLESVQHDYQLSLRLGLGFNFEDLHASMQDGVLTVLVPKRNNNFQRHRRVA